MKKHIIAIVVSAVTFLLIFLFFSFHFKNAGNAVTPPAQSEENQEILEAFQNSIGQRTSYQLQFPRSGSYRNAFIKVDLDGDGQNEVLAFYTTPATESLTRINVLDKQDDKWVSVLDQEGYGAAINSVDIDDLNNDHVPEVILTWDKGFSNEVRTLTVQEFSVDRHSNLQMDLLLDQDYKYMGLADMDGDARNELLVVWPKTENSVERTYASLFRMNGRKIEEYGKRAALDSEVSGYASLKFQKSGGRNIAMLDATKGENGMITEVIWWDKQKQALVAPFTDNDNLRNTATYRSVKIPCRDINGDSKIDIPVAESGGLPAKTGSDETPLARICWYQVSVKGEQAQLLPQNYSFVDTANHYVFLIPYRLRRQIVAARSTAGVSTFYRAQAGGAEGQPLFSIVVKQQSSMTKADTYTFRVNHGSTVAYGTLTNVGSSLGFSNDSISQRIIFY